LFVFQQQKRKMNLFSPSHYLEHISQQLRRSVLAFSTAATLYVEPVSLLDSLFFFFFFFFFTVFGAETVAAAAIATGSLLSGAGDPQLARTSTSFAIAFDATAEEMGRGTGAIGFVGALFPRARVGVGAGRAGGRARPPDAAVLD
jgi:hypothetical protein